MSNWEQVMAVANRKARAQHRRYSVLAQRWTYGGKSGWHYVAIPSVFRGIGHWPER